ncbi:DUF2236 domain-containing protein [Allosaccharopolyspora coralli]|uniref:DUF2236 domain-containing protein n=1 Tax=Allosaccharopolyspora coralli TaxID=2665642 RepID=A0A5Q3QI32_9PSEU|nr:oxygenase MpaB family protein [Allosaccharopolyspora coralli]QGK70497.1 DUF2236 domain-containing protein [Allosaccharopolyspora coralli]
MQRFDRLRHILELDPERDCDEIYRLLSQYEFPWDITRSLELALFRTYAVPAIGRLLDATGEFTRCPQKRYDDTVLVLYEILQSEVDSERRRDALDQLNRIHGRYRISNDDFVYTLATFVVVPVRWIENYGWRRLHPREVRGLTNAMRRMGEGMRLDGIPETYEEFERLLDGYERERFAFDAGGKRVADATMKLFGSWFPPPLAGPVGGATRLLMDPHLLDAFALPRPPRVLRTTAQLALKLRGALIRLGPPRPDSRPVLPNTPTYPHGYEITELGPESFHRSRAASRPARVNT